MKQFTDVMQPLLERFLQYKPREQWLLLLAAVAIIVLIYFKLIVQPLAGGRSDLIERNAAATESLAWMQASAAKVQASRQGQPTAAGKGGNISTLLNGSVAKHQLSFSRFQPRGADKAHVWLDGVAYSNVLQWLSAMQEQSIYVSNASIANAYGKGQVNLNLQMQRQ